MLLAWGKSTGLPKNNTNPLKHGDYTREAKVKRKLIRKLLKESADLIDHCARELLQQETLTEQQLLDMTRNMYRAEAT